MNIKYADLHIDVEQWNGLLDQEKVQKIKAVSKLVMHNGFTKTDIVFLLKEAVRIAELGGFDR